MTDRLSPIQARQVSKCIGGRLVLCGIDLEIAAGECVALTGDNGAGKTTLLRCLAALTRPTSGEVRWFGQLAANQPAQRRLIGMLAHESHLYAHLTLRENLLFTARMWMVNGPNERVDALLDQIGLRPFADHQVWQISRGMRQRLALARAVVHQPPILLLDEPFSGLDAAGREWLAGLLREQRADGCAVCFATHSKQQIRELADRTSSLHEGWLPHRTPTLTAATTDVTPRAA